MSLQERVTSNLLHYCDWADLRPLETTTFVVAKPPTPINNNTITLSGHEFVLPLSIHDKVTLNDVSLQFKDLQEAILKDPQLASCLGVSAKIERIIAAICGDDGTIVYYIIHNGIVKPRKN